MTTYIIQLIILFFLVLIIVAELVWLVKLVVFASRGAPYKTTDDETLEEIVSAIKLKKGGKVVDLGSGDGKIVIALAQQGFEAYGIELNSLLVWWTNMRIKKLGLEKKAFIYKRDMWKEDMSQYDVVIIYQITYIMKRMEKKLRTEMNPGSLVISNHFTFPTWKLKQKKGRMNIYQR